MLLVLAGSGDASAQGAVDPEIAASRLLVRGMTRAFLGDLDGALEFYDQALRFRPDDPTLQAALAQIYVAKEDVVQASFYAERAVSLAPDRPENVRLVAELRESTGDAVGSLEAYSTLVALIPGDLGARIARARLLAGLEQRSAALEAFLEAAALGPLPEDVLVDVLEVQMTLGELDDALATVGQLITIEQTASRQRMRAEILVRLGRDQEAVSAFLRALEIEPEDQETLAALQALAPDQLPKPLDAAGPTPESAAVAAVEAEEDLRNLGRRLRAVDLNLAVRDLDTALRLVEDGLLFFPGNAEVVLQAVEVYLHRLDPAQAMGVLTGQESLRDDADWTQTVLAGRGVIEWLQGADTASIEVPTEGPGMAWAAISGADTRGALLTGPSARLGAALIMSRAESAAPAAADLDHDLKSSPGSALEWLVLGDLWEAAGRRQRALDAWRTALASAPESPVVLSRLQ
ncbi:MAG: tetratricopeptide (TPR) repeat protein [Rhodothermales bacterium]